jgi:hypothetical protein
LSTSLALDVQMNADYLNLQASMAPPARSPLRRPPPPSPSRTLIGMEKAIPPSTTSPQPSPLSLTADTDKPLPQRPQRSRRSSSVYSGDSGYTKIIELYTNWTVDDEPATPSALQPIASRETLTGLLARRFTESSSPISPLTIPHFPKHAVSIPSLRFTSEDLPATSAVDVKAAPSFVEFSRSLKAKRSDIVSPLSSLASPHYAAVSHDTFWQPSLRSSPEFRAIAFEYEREHLRGEVSPRTTDVVNSDLVPSLLDIGRSSGSSDYQSLNMPTAGLESEMVLSEQGSGSTFPRTSSSDSSFVVYTGVRESIRAIIRSKMGKKKDSAQKGKEGAESVASIKDQMPSLDSSRQPERKFSWVSSRKSSLQGGVTSLFRSLSLTKSPSPNRQTPSSPRVRQKQLVIPLTSYQKYGTAVWHNSQRKKRRQARAARAAQISAIPSAGIRRIPTQNRRRNPHQRPSEVLTAFQSGRDQILDVLDETKQKIPRTNSEKRREGLKTSITLQGPGEKHEIRHKILRTGSEKRREKLKKSIALIGPVDPYKGEYITKTGSEGRRGMLKDSIKLVGPIEGEAIRQAESWL